MNPVSLLSEIISIPSLSGQENAVSDMLEAVLRESGLNPQRCGNNLWCRSGSGPAILMDAHIDTVHPASGYTRNPFSPEIEGGKLFGLGSNDDGGSVVAMIEAYKRLISSPQPYTLVLSLSAEEETGGKNGLEAVLPEIEAAVGPIRFGLIGEPTSLQMATSEKGLMVLDCEAAGKSGHAARGEGINAIYEALPDIQWFRSWQFPDVSEDLGPVKMTVTQISAGTQHNVVPDSCRFVVDVRSNACYSNEELLGIIRENVHCSVKPRSTRLQGTSIDKAHPAVQRGLSLGLKAFGSPTLSNRALCRFPTLKLGPGDSARSHTADEYICINDIEAAIDIYFKLLSGLSI